jgi:predicted ATPase
VSRFQRKGWEQLSVGYRRRLERGGIGKTDYDAGASLDKARGKEKERQLARDLKEWKDKQRVFYGRKPKEIDAAAAALSKDELKAMLAIQAEAEQLYDPRVLQKDRPKTDAHKVWLQRDKSLPEWLYYYHGFYS